MDSNKLPRIIDFNKITKEQLALLSKDPTFNPWPSFLFLAFRFLYETHEELRSDRVAKQYNQHYEDIFNKKDYTTDEKFQYVMKKQADINKAELLPDKLPTSFSSFLTSIIEQNPLVKKYFNAKFQELENQNKYFPSQPVVSPKLESKETRSVSKKNGINTFIWEGKGGMDDVDRLFNFLTKQPYMFISPETKLSDFRLAFSGNKISEPLFIKWLPIAPGKLSNRSLLLFLFNSLSDRNLIKKIESTETFNDQIHQIFCNRYGELFDRDKLKSSQYYLNSKGPTITNSDIISQILSPFG